MDNFDYSGYVTVDEEEFEVLDELSQKNRGILLRENHGYNVENRDSA